uniref:NADH-ubiquinone oxidoreductase chain 1 n=1 Tax=Ischalia sp. BMNH 840493 TaxID=904169 RepID=E3VTK8_9CUCU|nr:NADH dehydrogenase subunit 1 [Ischalia sp. BMNH 840493]
MILKDLILLIVSMILLLICVLVGVAFLTLLERKVLGYIQLRKGPNKVGLMGILQPFSDAIKLFTKEQTYPYMSNFSIYYLSPVMNLLISLFLWLSIPFLTILLNFNLSLMFMLSVMSLGVYSMMMAGWASNSKYSLLGSIRAVAQTVSYEISLSLILMCFIYMILSFNLMDLTKVQSNIWLFFMFIPLVFMWVITCLAETNRTPFDFAEGESELVSGFNIEYSSGGFAMIFLSEYSMILFMSFICVLMFMGGDLFSYIFYIKLVIISFFWIWVRGTLPRFRYDKLMYLAWKSFLPSVLSLLVFYFSLKFFFVMLFF